MRAYVKQSGMVALDVLLQFDSSVVYVELITVLLIGLREPSLYRNKLYFPRLSCIKYVVILIIITIVTEKRDQS